MRNWQRKVSWAQGLVSSSDDGSACPKVKSDRYLAGQATCPRKETPFRAWCEVPPTSAAVRACLWVHLAGRGFSYPVPRNEPFTCEGTKSDEAKLVFH